MRKFLTPGGRLTRLDFWLFNIVAFVAFFAAGAAIATITDGSDIGQIILGVLFIPLMVVSLIVQINRCHDRDKSGWWVLMNLIPIIGSIWVLVELGCLRGTEGDNRFGSDPKS